MGWRAQIASGYPWRPLAFLAAMLVMTGAWLWSVACAVPAEENVIARGTHVTAHVKTTKIAHRRRADAYYADLTWQDDQGHPRSYDNLAIGAGAYFAIGSGATTEIIYLGDERPVVVADLGGRARERSDAWVGLVLCGIVVLMTLYHWRRRLREWRAPKPVQW